MSAIHPLGDRLVVEPSEAEEKTSGGLYIPSAHAEKPQTGVILAVGPGRVTDQGILIPTAPKVGDRILFGKYSGTEMPLDGKSVLIIKESDVMAVLI